MSIDQAQQRVWFITGASTGLGRVLAEHLLGSGAMVVATARKVEQLKELEAAYPATALILSLDVTKQSHCLLYTSRCV